MIRADADVLVRSPAPEPGRGVELATAPATVHDPVTGDLAMVLARYPADDLAAFRRAALRYPMDSTHRNVGIRNVSRVFGYGARNVVLQRNTCAGCYGARIAPQAHAGLTSAAVALAALLASVAPDVAARDAAAGEAVLADWRLHDTQWTSGVLNRTSPLPYHYDRNNLEPVWSAMIVARRGVRGGHLHVPELDVTVACRDGDVVFFPGWRYVHGVTPARVIDRDGYRLTAVFYAVRKMAACLPFADEVAHGRADRTAREGDLRPVAERLGPRR